MINKERMYGLDFLRIIAMAFIVGYHFMYWGGALDKAVMGTFSYYFVWIANAFFHVMVNVFVLISGYFLSHARVNTKSIIKFVCQVWMISVILYGLTIVMNAESFSFKSLLFAITPITSREYWFATNYVGMLLLAPILNFLISKMSDIQLKTSWMILILLFSVFPTVFFFSDTLKFGNAHGIVWFIVLYFTGAVLRKNILILSKRNSILIYVVTSCFIMSFKFILDMLASKHMLGHSLGFLHDYSVMFYQYYTIPVFLGAIGLFEFFLRIDIKKRLTKRLISFMAPNIFYVYLIHDNGHFRYVIWDLINSKNYLEGFMLPIIMIATVLFFLIIPCLIGSLISRVIGLVVNLRFFVWLENKIDAFFAKIQN